MPVRVQVSNPHPAKGHKGAARPPTKISYWKSLKNPCPKSPHKLTLEPQSKSSRVLKRQLLRSSYSKGTWRGSKTRDQKSKRPESWKIWLERFPTQGQFTVPIESHPFALPYPSCPGRTFVRYPPQQFRKYHNPESTTPQSQPRLTSQYNLHNTVPPLQNPECNIFTDLLPFYR